MRVVVFVAIAVVVMAALHSLGTSEQIFSRPNAIGSVVLIAALAIQRINGIQRWLSGSRDKRRQQIDKVAQQILLELCKDRKLTDELLDLRVHVWEVPLWYRRLLPYWLRQRTKALVSRKFFRIFAALTIRPSLHRAAAVGLVKLPPSGIRFRKGLGLVGVCLANNDRAEYITLNISDGRYEEALRSRDEAAWLAYGQEITHGLARKDAVKLSHSYGQVIARVVQDPESGEAIGCATISVKETNFPGLKVTSDPLFRRKVTDLAIGAATILAA